MRNIKLVVLGDRDIKKTEIIDHYLQNNTANANKASTDPNVKTGTMKGQNYEVCVWDITNIEEYDRLLINVYKGTDVFLILFNLSAPNFSKSARGWISDARQYSTKTPVIFVGLTEENKLETNVPAEINKLIDEYESVSYQETSLNDVKRINNIFQSAISCVLFNRFELYPFFKNFKLTNKTKSFIEKSIIIAQGSRQADSHLSIFPKEMIIEILTKLGANIAPEKSIMLLVNLIVNNIKASKPEKLNWKRVIEYGRDKIAIYPSFIGETTEEKNKMQCKLF